MTPERWQQIDQLFKAALACERPQREEFLAAKCVGDEPLRREVESLLSSLEDADGFIETPAGDIAAELLGTHRSTYEPGQQIQNYRIARQLGSGGMGEVYLADDIRLNRKVALKLLPPHFTVNPDRVRRFEREARAASALNHPNIVTIYEIGKSNTTHFIAAEFVDGKTLRQLINEKPHHSQRSRFAHPLPRSAALSARLSSKCKAAADEPWAGNGHCSVHVAGAGTGKERRHRYRHLVSGNRDVRVAGRTCAVLRRDTQSRDGFVDGEQTA